MVIFPLAPDQTIAQMWSNGAGGGGWGEKIQQFSSFKRQYLESYN